MLVAVGVAAMLALFPRPVKGADTTEPWDVGATDYEYYLVYDGIGLATEDQTIATEGVAGFGILPRLSGGFGTALQGNGYLAVAEVNLDVWLFATLIDSDHFDWDVSLLTGVGGPGLGEIAVAPGFEFNLDTQPDLSGLGLYLRVEEVLSGEETTPPPAIFGEEPEPTYERTFETAGLVGAYATPATDHQILVEFDATVVHSDDHALNLGMIALGYNVCLTDGLELITAVSVNVPQVGETIAGGVLAGMIATLPGGGK